MEQTVTFLVSNWKDLLRPIGLVALTLFVMLVVRHYLFRSLRRWALTTASKIDDIVVDALSAPFMLWALILGLHLAMQASPLPDRITQLSARLLLVCWIISLTLVGVRLAGAIVQRMVEQAHGPQRVTSLTQNLARMAAAALGILILLNSVGLEITPILTALGVGGLAVALALQDTLSNLFAGFYISLAGQVRIGDYVKIDSGEEGYVTDITWRATTIRMLANNLIIVPNAKLAQAIVTNFHLPEKRMSLSIPVGVSYESDPRHIESVLVEEATTAAASGEIPGLLSEPAPFVRFIPGYGDSSLNFTLICQVAEFVDQYFAQHELRKRIFQRFRSEGIEIPFPIRTIYFKNPEALSTGPGGQERA